MFMMKPKLARIGNDEGKKNVYWKIPNVRSMTK